MEGSRRESLLVSSCTFKTNKNEKQILKLSTRSSDQYRKVVDILPDAVGSNSFSLNVSRSSKSQLSCWTLDPTHASKTSAAIRQNSYKGDDGMQCELVQKYKH